MKRFKLFTWCCLFVMGIGLVPNSTLAQLSLTSSPYTESFDGIGSGYPTGWSGRTGANATTLGTLAALTTTHTAWTSTGGNFHNSASQETTDGSGSTDRVFAVRQTGSFGDPGAAFVLQIDNTTGKSSFNLSLKIQQLHSTSAGRTTTWAVDYGIGATPSSFTAATTNPVTITTLQGTTTSTNVTIDFGSALDNQADNVWIRIVALGATTGGGTRPHTAIDDVELTWSTGSNPNLNFSPTSNNFGTVTVGSQSAGFVFSINGTSLTGAPGNITITRPNSDFQLSLDNSAWGSSVNIPYSAATLDSTGFYVRFDPQSAGAKSGDLNIAGGGVSSPPTISLSGTGATTSSSSNIIVAAGFNEPENIAYHSFQATDITDLNSVEVARFSIQDGGNGLSDADALATTVTAITFNVSNHANLSRIALYDGTTELAEVAAGSTAVFSGLTAVAADNGIKNLSVRVTFAASVIDRAQFSFTVASITADGAGSLFASADGGAPVSSTTGDRNKIQVTATLLAFVQQPSTVGSGNNMSPTVTISANDALGNRDIDFTANVQITSTGTLTGSPVIQTAVAGLASFNTLVHTATGTSLQLTAARNPEGDRTVTSSNFDVVLLPAAGEIVINQFSQDYGGSNDEYVELVNKTDKTFDLGALRISYQSAAGGTGGAGGILSGTLQPYSFWLVSPNATITVGLTSGLARDGAMASGLAAGAGQIAIQVIANNAIIDAVGYGTITGGTFTEGGNGAATAAPTSDGGSKRNTDGVDTDNNNTDFSTVTNANIYLRNSNSRLAVAGAAIPAGTYTDLVVTGNASLSGAVSLNNRLELVSGVLTTNGNLTLVSNAANDAANVFGGTNTSIVGNVTVQRFLPWASANNNGFRFVSHPLRTNPQLNTITNLPTDLNTVIGLDEDLNGTEGGYFAYTDRSVVLGQANAIGVWTNAANTLSFTGELQLDAIPSVSLAFAGTSTGWNFMGNPFPNVLDWDEVTKSASVSNASYVWIKDDLAVGGGNWGTYINGTSANGGNRYLAVGQGFIVKANSSSPAPTISFPTSSRITNQSPNFNLTASNPDELRIRLNRLSDNYSIETVIKFDQQATQSFDPLYDAEMMRDDCNCTPDIYTTDIEGVNYAIQSLAIPNGEHQIVPLQLETFGAGNFDFEVDLSRLASVAKVELQDTKLNTFTTLTNNSILSFQADNNDAIARFKLHFNRAERTQSTVSTKETVFDNVNVYSYENEIFVRGLDWADQFRIFDLTGRMVFEIIKPDFTVGTLRPQLAAGTYLVKLTRNGSIKTVKVVLQ